jgi:serine/threonine protein kinase
VIVQAGYDTSADMWSLACLCFELLTGDLLFDPQSGSDFSRDDDHLALMVELLGKPPFHASILHGDVASRFFDGKNDLKNIRKLKSWPLEKVLEEKYRFERARARATTDFLLPLLAWDPAERASAKGCSASEWLNPAS